MSLQKGNTSLVRKVTVVALGSCFSAPNTILSVLVQHGPDISTVRGIAQQWRGAKDPRICPQYKKEDPVNWKYWGDGRGREAWESNAETCL